MMKGVYIFLAEGFEEIEALSAVDALRRAGVDVRTVAVSSADDLTVIGAHGIPVVADLPFAAFRAAEEVLMVFPGGLPGAANLAAHKDLMARMKSHFAAGGTVAAICAAPGLVVSQLDGLEGRRFTCYDGFEEAPAAKGAVYVKAPAVTDGNLITGRGPGYAWDFALALVACAAGKDAAQRVRRGLFME